MSETDYPEKLQTITEALDVCQLELNDWETDFMNNVYYKEEFTDKQKDVIDGIYERLG